MTALSREGNGAPTTTPAWEGGRRVDREFVVRRIFPLARTLIRVGYFSVEVVGAEHIPREGRFEFAPNHAGWFPLDAFVLGYAVAQAIGPDRTPIFAVHDAALAVPLLGTFLRRCGALPASWFRRPERLPADIESLVIFPEGARGNTKPFWEAYRMRDWSRGVVRTAIARASSIVPVALLGTEESMPVAWQLKAVEPFLGAAIGIPMAPLPLPARFKVVFHKPVPMSPYGREKLTDSAFCTAMARRIQNTVQATLDHYAAEYPLAVFSAAVHGIRLATPDPSLRRASRS
jgi:1-acyl-sn-glycerol-3-phosphate acyltransferase